MVEECKEFEKQAKQNEKGDPDKAVTLYKEAAECYERQDNNKRRNSNYEKAAKLLREKARSTVDPQVALPIFEESSILYKKIEKESEMEKITKEAQQKFLNVAKQIQVEARKMDDIAAAEEKLSLASIYFIKAGDEQLSHEAWIDSGDQFYKAANGIEDPLQALDVFNHAIQNYRKGYSEDKELKSINDAAMKFYKKALEIYKTNKDLIIAYYHFTQAVNISIHMGDAQKQVQVDEKVAEIRDIMGMPDEVLLNYLNSKDLKPVSIAQEGERPRPVSVSDSVETVISSVMKREELDTPTTGIVPEEVVSPMKSTTEFETKETETPSTADDQPTSDTWTRPETQVDEISEMKPDDDLRNKIREEFLQGREEPEVIDESRQEKIDHLLDNSLSKEVENLIPELEKEFSTDMFLEPISSYELPAAIVDILRAQGYVDRDVIMGDELRRVPEYEILSIIIQNHPITSEEIETKTNISSISMVLSNLTADGLVEQTNDYRYTITRIVENGLEEQVAGIEDLGDMPETVIEQLSGFEVQVIAALNKYGIISNTEISSAQLKRIAEFEIIRFLKNQSAADLDAVKGEVTNIPSVQVTSMLSRLEVDGIVSQTADGHWSLSESFLTELRS